MWSPILSDLDLPVRRRTMSPLPRAPIVVVTTVTPPGSRAAVAGTTVRAARTLRADCSASPEA
jgi:hypothetical protein